MSKTPDITLPNKNQPPSKKEPDPRKLISQQNIDTKEIEPPTEDYFPELPTKSSFSIPSTPDTPQYRPVLSDSFTDIAPIENSILEADIHPAEVSADEIGAVVKDPVHKKILKSELDSMDMYLHNVHRGFRYVTSISGITALINNGLQVHAHRRKILNDVANLAGLGGNGNKGPSMPAGVPDGYEFDNMGNLVRKV